MGGKEEENAGGDGKFRVFGLSLVIFVFPQRESASIIYVCLGKVSERNLYLKSELVGTCGLLSPESESSFHRQ